MVEYYQQRSNAGLIISEAAAISEEGSGWPNAPRIYLPEHVTGWKKVVDAVHKAGSIMYCELWHIGRPRFIRRRIAMLVHRRFPWDPGMTNQTLME
jgi:2,4-dienoyl-CoA reductase-like NADH-dependent reductase (Old Yellow Enzyme family)